MLLTADGAYALIPEKDNTLNGVWVGLNGIWDGASVQLGYIDSEGAGVVIAKYLYGDDFVCVVPITEREIIAVVSNAGASTSLALDAHPTNSDEYNSQDAGFVSNANSSADALPDAGVYTGEWVSVGGHSHLSVAVKTDQNGHFSVQYSPDKTNVDSTLTRQYRTNQIEVPHVFVNARQYARVVFTNDSDSAQTYFRLQTMVGTKGQLNAPMDSTLAQDFDATVTRPTDFHTEAALSRRQGVTTWNKFGYNDDVDVGTEVIASWGGTFQYITAGETIDIVSSSTADDSGGTGVNSVVVYGVDENWDEQTVVYTMDGTTTVTSAESWIGINRVAIFLAGTAKGNVGEINVTATTSGYTMAQMPTGGGVTQQMVFYVPRNHNFLAEWLRFEALKTSGGGNPEIIYRGWVYSAVNNAEQEVYRGQVDTQRANAVDVSPPIPFPVGEKSILWFTAETDTVNTQVGGRMCGELFRDVDA